MLRRRGVLNLVRTSNNVETAGNKVASCFDNVTSTLLPMWTGRYRPRQTTYDRRRQTPASKTILPPTLCVGGSVIKCTKVIYKRMGKLKLHKTRTRVKSWTNHKQSTWQTNSRTLLTEMRWLLMTIFPQLQRLTRMRRLHQTHVQLRSVLRWWLL